MLQKIVLLCLFAGMSTGLFAQTPTSDRQPIAPVIQAKLAVQSRETLEIERLKAELAAMKGQQGGERSNKAALLPASAKIEMIELPSGILIGKYEVTRAQFAAFVDATGYDTGSTCWTKEKGEWGEHQNRSWRNPGANQDSNHPVVCVSFSDVEAYVRWLNATTGMHYRLPSQDEWYSACQAGGYNTDYCGSNGIDAVGWYEGNSGGSTHSVGLKQPNAFGLYDMSGNVWEWTSTCYETDCTRRVARGGSWGNQAGYASSEALNWNDVPARYDLLGFRLALER